jgi:thiamine biosynthesis lipoprotein
MLTPLLLAAVLAAESRAFPIMGTDARLTIEPPAGAAAQAALDAAEQALRDADRTFSDWRDDSELARVNAAAYSGPVTVSAEFANLLGFSLTLARRSGGAFDPTFAPLYRLWPFRGGVTTAAAPSAMDIGDTLRDVGYRQVTLDEIGRKVRFDGKHTELGFDAVAKGLALDRAAEALERHGVGRYLIELGGQWLRRGEGTSRLALRDPFGGAPRYAIEVTQGSLSTSAGYEHRLWVDGRWLGHILDPRTGRPVEGTAAVIVASPSGLWADGLSTALFVLGPEAGGRLLAEYPGSSALWIRDDGTRVTRGAFPPLIDLPAPTSPTAGGARATETPPPMPPPSRPSAR